MSVGWRCAWSGSDCPERMTRCPAVQAGVQDMETGPFVARISLSRLPGATSAACAQLGPIRPRLEQQAELGRHGEGPGSLGRAPARWRRSSRVRWTLSQTPALCQSRSRFQHVIPVHPSSCGRSSHGMPVRKTNTMPVRAMRSGVRGRPRRERRCGFGMCGSIIAHSSSSTRRRAMPTLPQECGHHSGKSQRLPRINLGALSAALASLLDHKAILTTEEQATLATIGANVEMRVRDLQEFLQEWMGTDQP